MGLLKFFKSEASTPQPLPSGSFTVDKTGRITTSTVPRSFPAAAIQEIAEAVLATFRQGQETGVNPAEITFLFGGIKMRAREMRGGAMVFFLKNEN
jgi:hypothetical protein